MGRAVGDGETGGGDLVHLVRERHHVLGARDGLLGERAMIHHRQHPLPAREATHAGAHRLDLARELEARRERQGGLLLVAPAQHQAVGEIHPRGANPDTHAASARFRHGQIDQFQRVGSLQRTADDRSHGTSDRSRAEPRGPRGA